MWLCRKNNQCPTSSTALIIKQTLHCSSWWWCVCANMILPLGWHGQSPQPALCAFGTITRRGSGKSLRHIKQSPIRHIVMFVCLVQASLSSSRLLIIALILKNVVRDSLFFACDITTYKMCVIWRCQILRVESFKLSEEGKEAVSEFNVVVPSHSYVNGLHLMNGLFFKNCRNFTGIFPESILHVVRFLDQSTLGVK